MDIATQVNTYFAAAADATAPGEAVPNTTTGNTVTPMIDGRRYFRAIRTLLSSLGTGPMVGNQFFYVTGWWLHLTSGPGVPVTTATQPATGAPQSPTTRTPDTMAAFRLEDDQAGPYPLMAQLLAEKAAAGVDVRVMGWVNPILLLNSVANQVGGYWNVVTGNLLSIKDLRSQTVGGARPLAKRVCALSVGNVLGAMHLKMVVAHDGTKPWAFIGGIDFVPTRVAGEMHPGTEDWHDMAVAVDGPGIQVFYDLFRNLWNEQLARPNSPRFLLSGNIVNGIESGTSAVPPRTLPSTGTGTHRLQVARTLAQYNFSTIRPQYGVTPLSFAPNGVFEVKVAWRRAIANASQYIYIEDQSFWSQDVMDWINDRVKNNSTVKVILLTGAPDPADPPNDGPLVEAINNHLLTGLTASQQTRIGFFLRKNIIVHTKVTIIDDYWLFVGSANCMRRSLYTDGEMSIAALDERTTNRLAKQVRVNLWGGHFGKAPGTQRASLNNLNRALAVWEPAWGSAPPYSLPAALIDTRPLPLPLAVVPFDPGQYILQDADSRDTY
jgi:phosphatidylserine/phosphatidylglycerophosphate/cardiolipin synthase-like enzyme